MNIKDRKSYCKRVGYQHKKCPQIIAVMILRDFIKFLHMYFWFWMWVCQRIGGYQPKLTLSFDLSHCQYCQTLSMGGCNKNETIYQRIILWIAIYCSNIAFSFLFFFHQELYFPLLIAETNIKNIKDISSIYNIESYA